MVLNEELSKSNPLISVIIPCYNYGRFVKEAVDSVLRQTFRDFEIIIVNDGSTDEFTIKILKDIKKEHPEILIINQENGHLSNARNNGIKASKGEFILPLDADDIIDSTMLEKCYEQIKRNDKLGLVYTGVKLFGDVDEIWESKEYDFYALTQSNYIVATSLIRKKAWAEVGGYDENMKKGYEDWEFYIRMGKNGWFGKLLREPLFCYRKHGKSMIDDALRDNDLNVEYVQSKHRDIYNDSKMNEIKRQQREIEDLKKIIQERDLEIMIIKNSKFWKFRDLYLKIKNKF